MITMLRTLRKADGVGYILEVEFLVSRAAGLKGSLDHFQLLLRNLFNVDVLLLHTEGILPGPSPLPLLDRDGLFNSNFLGNGLVFCAHIRTREGECRLESK